MSNSYKIEDDVTTLYAGDSHMEAAINDKRILNGRNISRGGETYYFTYYKLKSLIEKNQKIKKVFIGLSAHNLSKRLDLLTNGDRSYHYAPPYFYILPIEEKIRVVLWNLPHLNTFLKNVIQSGFDTIITEPVFLGAGFTNESKLSASKGAIKIRVIDLFYEKENLIEFSDLNISYLKKIMKLCKIKNIELFALDLPLHPYFYEKIPSKFILKLEELIKKEKMNIIDFKHFTAKDEDFMPDGDHLSLKGAQLMTSELMKKYNN
jgi:hypothetical protein